MLVDWLQRLDPMVKRAYLFLTPGPITPLCLAILGLPLLIAAIASLIYIGFFIIGLVRGHLFPSAEIFLFCPWLGAIFHSPERLAKAVFIYALVGFCLSWIMLRGRDAVLCRKSFAWLNNYWALFSFLIIFSLLYATLGYIYFSHGANVAYSELAGIIPFNDANGHYSSYIQYFYDGIMGDWVLRRPLAAFFGASIHWLAGNDPTAAIMMRCLLLGFSIWMVIYNINYLYGVWSAVCCVALTYSYIFKYLCTFLTEPLGFFWGGVAAALWLQALHEKGLFWDLAAFAVTVVGLLTRMGAMFLIPVLSIYILWKWRCSHSGHGWWKKPSLSLCICIIAIVLLNTGLAGRGTGTTQTASNFSYTFVGLTLGTTWDGSIKVYAKEISELKNEKEVSYFLYKQGIKNILNNPFIFFKRLLKGEIEFLRNINFFIFGSWHLIYIICFLLFINYKYIFSKLSSLFWIIFWSSILLSIPFIYFDDSWRVNIFVYPLIACFFSLSMAQQCSNSHSECLFGCLSMSFSAKSACVLSCGLLLLMTSVAFFPDLHTPSEVQKIRKYVASLSERTGHLVLGRSGGVGFLVVSDTETADLAVPSVTWKKFMQNYQKFEHNHNNSFFDNWFPELPFAAICRPPIGEKYGYFIAPPEVLTEKNVLLWNLETDNSAQLIDKQLGIPWRIVTKATPLLYK